MGKLPVLGLVLAIGVGSAFAAPNVTNATQKGSLLVWPDIRVDGDWNTLIRIQNDNSRSIDVLCYWMDGNKHRVDFVITLTAFQAIWFDARTGHGSLGGNAFPSGAANGFDNPFLITPGAPDEDSDDGGSYRRGLLACWAVDGGAQHQVKWNHLSGTATVYSPTSGAYEYNAYAFFVPIGLDKSPVGPAGTLNLNGVEYDSCPLYQIAQFPTRVTGGAINGRRLAIVGCTLYLNQDWIPVWTKYQFDAWNADDVKLTGSFRCADSWHESPSGTDPLVSTGIRYRVQGVQSTQCSVDGVPVTTQAVGVIAIQSTRIDFAIGTTTAGGNMTAAGKFTGKIVWDAAQTVPEGGVR